MLRTNIFHTPSVCHPLVLSPAFRLSLIAASCKYLRILLGSSRLCPPKYTSPSLLPPSLQIRFTGWLYCTGPMLVVSGLRAADVLAFLYLTCSRALASSWSGTDRLDEPSGSVLISYWNQDHCSQTPARIPLHSSSSTSYTVAAETAEDGLMSVHVRLFPLFVYQTSSHCPPAAPTLCIWLHPLSSCAELAVMPVADRACIDGWCWHC